MIARAISQPTTYIQGMKSTETTPTQTCPVICLQCGVVFKTIECVEAGASHGICDDKRCGAAYAAWMMGGFAVTSPITWAPESAPLAGDPWGELAS